MKRKVYWTAEERDAMHRKMIVLFSAKPHLTKQKALQLAQTALPKDRWRNIVSVVASRHGQWIERARQIALEKQSLAPTLEARTFPLERKSTVAALKENAIDSALDAMAEAMAQKIMQRVQNKLFDSMNNQGAVAPEGEFVFKNTSWPKV